VNQPPVIALASNTVLQSQFNGAAQIFWSPASTYGAVAGAQVLALFLSIQSVSGTNPKFRVVGQWSLDGESWAWFARDLTSARTALVDPMSDRYVGKPFGVEFAAFVRFGIMVESTTLAGQVQGRVSAQIIPYF
jgi:hypothetical protein